MTIQSLKTTKVFTLAELTHGLDVTIKGDPQCEITGIAPIQCAQAGQLTFLNNSLINNSRYGKYLATTGAAAVVLSPKEADQCAITAIVSTNPYYTYACIAAYFQKTPKRMPGIHPTAVVGKNCHIDSSATICAQVVIGDEATIGANVYLGPGCVIGDNATIGEQTQLDARVVIYHHVHIGKRVRMASGVVIGSDGFGFAKNKQAWHKVPQLGSVVIGDDVDIGANTTIDRGAIEDTIIEDGVKLDNLIQLGHNVKIGAHTIMAGCSGVAGSAEIGKHCMIGGGSAFAGHIVVCDNAAFTGMTMVTKSITEPAIYSSGIVGAVPNEEFRKNNARFHRLGNLMQRVKQLEAAVASLMGRENT